MVILRSLNNEMNEDYARAFNSNSKDSTNGTRVLANVIYLLLAFEGEGVTLIN